MEKRRHAHMPHPGSIHPLVHHFVTPTFRLLLPPIQFYGTELDVETWLSKKTGLPFFGV